jgi:hypothetical protein
MHRMIVNSNGDTANGLLQPLLAVSRAMESALDAVREIRPNGRNYQINTAPADDLSADAADVQRMFRQLAAMRDEINVALIRLANMPGARGEGA